MMNLISNIEEKDGLFTPFIKFLNIDGNSCKKLLLNFFNLANWISNNTQSEIPVDKNLSILQDWFLIKFINYPFDRSAQSDQLAPVQGQVSNVLIIPIAVRSRSPDQVPGCLCSRGTCDLPPVASIRCSDLQGHSCPCGRWPIPAHEHCKRIVFYF